MKDRDFPISLPKCLLVMPTHSSFMEIDHEILRSFCKVIPIYLAQNESKRSYLHGILKLGVKLLTNTEVITTFVWFADYHAALVVAINKLLRHKTVIFIGGYDAVHYPELQMGVHSRALRSFCNKYSLRHADLIIANHESLIAAQNFYYTPQGHADGIRHFIPDLKTSTRILYNGIRFSPTPDLSSNRALHVLTIGLTPRREDFVNKGYDLLVEVARRNPDWQFAFVGISEQWIVSLDSEYHFTQLPNIQTYSWIENHKLKELYLNSAVYVQASISEGMPNSLIEAMYYGCIPVGSDVAGIPTVIDKYGVIIHKRDSVELAKAIAEALIRSDRMAIQEYIIGNFSIEIRKTKLGKILQETNIS